MRLDVFHTTVYRYAEPASDWFNEVRLKPVDDYRQVIALSQPKLAGR